MARRKASGGQINVGNVAGVSGNLNIAAGDINQTFHTIHQRALTAAEKATQARKLENRLLAQGIAGLVQNLSAKVDEGAQSDKPYKGLLPYNLNEAEIFYGRKQAVRDLLAQMGQSPLTVLHAESGAGKSSLLQAGIAAQLIANGHLAVYLRPYHTDPVEFTKRMFLPELRQAPSLAGGTLRDFLRQVCGVLGSKSTLHLLLDQFEEFFQLEKEERQPFLEALADCLNDPGLSVCWVLALRGESLSKLAALESVGLAPFKNTYSLHRLSRVEAREAIVEPASRHGIRFEPALIDHILNTLTTNDEVRPTHLQLVCSALTDDLPAGKVLTLTYYVEQEGDTEGILRDYLKRQLEDFPASEKILAWKLLRALITAERHRAVKTYDEIVQELKTGEADPVQVATILNRLVERRLLSAQTQPVDGEVFELAHDYLVKEIELDPQEQARKAAQELLDQETRAYQRYKTLLTPERLAVIEPYQDQLHVSAEAQALLKESQKALRAERRKQERRRNITLGVSVAVALGMSLLAYWGLQSSRDARRQAITSRAGELAAQSVALRDQDFRLSLLLGVEAFQLQPQNIQARGALRDAANAYPQLLQFLTGYSGSVVNAIFSPDGKTIASGYTDGSIVLWDVKSGKPIGQPLEGHEESVYRLGFSADGRLLLSAGLDNAVMLWDVASHKRVGQLPSEQTGMVSSAAISPDGRTLLTCCEKLILWDAASRQPIAQFVTKPGEKVSEAIFSPDGQKIASVTSDHRIVLWDVTSHQRIGQPLALDPGWPYSLAIAKDNQTLAMAGEHSITLWDLSAPRIIGQIPLEQSGIAYSIDFSPDGKTLAAAHDDHTIRLWDVASQQEIGLPFKGHTSLVGSVSFSPDGNTIVSTGFDNTVRLWRVALRQQIIGEPFVGQTKGETYGTIALSPDGTHLASVSGQTVTLWDVASRKPMGAPLQGLKKTVTGIAFSPDSKTLATGNCSEMLSYGACTKGEIVLWDVATGKQIGAPLVGHNNTVNSVAFSPDGTLLASGDQDNKIILWVIATRQLIGAPLTDHNSAINSLAFSPDGKLLASGSQDNTIILWDVTSRKQISRLRGHTSYISSLAFSPDGKRLASGAGDGNNNILLWDTASSPPAYQLLSGHTDPFGPYNVAFNPKDGQTLASVGGHELILWDVPSGQQIGQTIINQNGFMDGVTFSPDGRRLLTGGDQIILWNLDADSWVRQACQRAGGNLTSAEWERYFPNETYRRTCDQWPAAAATPTPVQ